MTNTTLIIVIVVAVVVIAAVAGFMVPLMKRRRTERLKSRFGPEYERSVTETDDPKQAEAELRQREKRHSEMELRPLNGEQRAHYEKRWSQVQVDFVDDPARAVRGADVLVTEVMSVRGYPEAEFDQRADDLSVSYPELTQHYRDARRISRANDDGNATTEDLRLAVTTYRSLVEHLLRDGRSEERATHDSHDKHEEGDERRTGDEPGARNEHPTRDEHRTGRTEEVQR